MKEDGITALEVALGVVQIKNCSIYLVRRAGITPSWGRGEAYVPRMVLLKER